MRAKPHKLSSVALMIMLLMAQTMGWCRAYVCDCSGTTEITVASHCHGVDARRFDHGPHDDRAPSDPQHCECCSHHDHELMAGSFSATGPRNDEAERLADVPFAIVTNPALPMPPWIPSGSGKLIEQRGRAPCHAPGTEMRRTVALLI